MWRLTDRSCPQHCTSRSQHYNLVNLEYLEMYEFIYCKFVVLGDGACVWKKTWLVALTVTTSNYGTWNLELVLQSLNATFY